MTNFKTNIVNGKITLNIFSNDSDIISKLLNVISENVSTNTSQKDECNTYGSAHN